MEFRDTLLAAQRNQQQKSSVDNMYYKARFDPPKKEQKARDKLSANIQKFLAKKEEEEKQKKLEAQRKREELLAMRDPKALRKIQKTLKVIKSANKSVLADAIDKDHTAITLEGPDQPDQDDYGYESQEAAAFYQKMMQKYSKIPDEPKFSTGKSSSTKDIDGTRERVKHALRHADDPVPHKRRRRGKNDDDDRESSPPDKYEPEKKKDEKPDKPKFKKPAPPPMDFNQLLKLAEQKKSVPVELAQRKAAAEPEPDRLMTKKQKREYEEEMARRQRRQERLDADKSATRKGPKEEKPVEREKKPESMMNGGRIPKLSDRNNASRNETRTQEKDRPTERERTDKDRYIDRERTDKDRHIDRERTDKDRHIDRERTDRDRHIDRGRIEKDRQIDRGRIERDRQVDRERTERDKHSDRERIEKIKEKEKMKLQQEREKVDRERLDRLKAERDRIDREMERLNKDREKLDKTKAKLESSRIPERGRPDKTLDKSKLNPKNGIDIKSQNTYRIDKNSNESKSSYKSIENKMTNGHSSQNKPVPKLSKEQDNRMNDRIQGKPKSLEGNKVNGINRDPKRPENGAGPRRADDRKPVPSQKPAAGSGKPQTSNSFDFDKHVNSLGKNGSKQFPPGQVKRKPHPNDMRRKVKRPAVHSDSEYDSEMDDFIDDGDENMDYSTHIREIFGYDKSKYRDMDDDDDPRMESTFAQQQREEYISKKIGIMEDLEDMRMEAMEKNKKKKRRRISDD